MTTLREAAQMALDALDSDNPDIQLRAATALRAALAQPEQEPTRSQKLRDAGYTRRPKGWSKDGEEPEPVGNTITFMTRAIFNVVANHQEINGGYFIADGDVAAFVDRLAKVINSTFEPLKPKNTAPPQREWQGLTDEDFIGLTTQQIFAMKFAEAKLREKNS